MISSNFSYKTNLHSGNNESWHFLHHFTFSLFPNVVIVDAVFHIRRSTHYFITAIKHLHIMFYDLLKSIKPLTSNNILWQVSRKQPYKWNFVFKKSTFVLNWWCVTSTRIKILLLWFCWGNAPSTILRLT